MMIQTNTGQSEYPESYENKSGAVTVAGAVPTTDLSTLAGFTQLFTAVGTQISRVASLLSISTTGTVYICFNSPNNDVITVTSTTPITNRKCTVSKIYIATAGVSVAITVSLQ